MQNQSAWTDPQRRSSYSDNRSSPEEPVPLRTLSSLSLNGMALPPLQSSQPVQHDIWSPMYSGLRGHSFGAYGAANGVPTSVSGSNSFSGISNQSQPTAFDNERFRSGGVAWGSADLPRRRMASFPNVGPGKTNRSASDSSSRSGTSSFDESTAMDSDTSDRLYPVAREPFLASLSSQAKAKNQLDFTAPAISVLERFSNLGDATRRAEIKRAEIKRAELSQQEAVKEKADDSNGFSLKSTEKEPIEQQPSMISPKALHTPSPQANSHNQGHASKPVPLSASVPVSGPVLSPASASGASFGGINTLQNGFNPPQSEPKIPRNEFKPPQNGYKPHKNGSNFSRNSKTHNEFNFPKTLPTDLNDRFKGGVYSGSSVPFVPPPMVSVPSGMVPIASYSSAAAPFVEGVPYQTKSTEYASHRSFKPRTDVNIMKTLQSSVHGELKMTDILGHISEASVDQEGSRFIQEKLGQTPPHVRQKIVAEVTPNIISLSTDVFGNYVVQLLFEICSIADRHTLWKGIQNHVLKLSMQMYGCRVIQIALRHLQLENQRDLVEEIRNHISNCITDHNGNHVVQKAIELMPPKEIGFIYQHLLPQTLQFSKHMYGCRVIQRALESGSRTVKFQILQNIRDNLDSLVSDQYGNYVVQHVVEHGPPSDREFVLKSLCDKIVHLSEHKYASNVIEKCFVKGNLSQRTLMVDLIVNGTSHGEPAVAAMMKDQYANYVIQRILGTARDSDYDRLAYAVKQNLQYVKITHPPKHLLGIERRLRD